MEAYFINPVERRGRKKTTKKRKNPMATAKQKAAARRNIKKAIAANRRKSGARRVSRKAHRKHPKGWYSKPKADRKYAKRRITYHRRKRAWRGRHLVRTNPFGGGQAGKALTQGLIAAGFILGGLFVVGMANRQMERVPMLQSGYFNLAGKLALALAGSMGALWAVRKGYISQGNGVALAGVAFVPMAVGALNRFMPNIAGQISLSADDMSAELQGPEDINGVVQYGDINADMDAELQAELQADMDSEDSGSY